MPRMQKELSRLQFQRDFADAQARYDLLEPEDSQATLTQSQEVSATYATDLSTHYYFVRKE